MTKNNFRIIIGDDPKLTEYIVRSSFSNYDGPIYIEDPIKSRHLFISKSFFEYGIPSLKSIASPSAFSFVAFSKIPKSKSKPISTFTFFVFLSSALIEKENGDRCSFQRNCG